MQSLWCLYQVVMGIGDCIVLLYYILVKFSIRFISWVLVINTTYQYEYVSIKNEVLCTSLFTFILHFTINQPQS